LSTEWRQSKAVIGSLTSLRVAIAVKEVQAMRSFVTSENPDMVMAEQELATMRAQLSVRRFIYRALAKASLQGLESDGL
jgi:hypothetical protein